MLTSTPALHLWPEPPRVFWGLSFPYPLRIMFTTHPAVLTQALDIVYPAVSTFLVRHEPDNDHTSPTTPRLPHQR